MKGLLILSYTGLVQRCLLVQAESIRRNCKFKQGRSQGRIYSSNVVTIAERDYVRNLRSAPLILCIRHFGKWGEGFEVSEAVDWV
jgi:hypothetical protein